MAHTEEDFSKASTDARFDVCLTTCTFAVNIRSGKADRKPIWLQQKYNTVKKKDDEEYKRGKGGCETALLPASFSMHCLWFVGDMKTAYAASRCQQTTICACLPLEEWLISLSDKQYVRFRLWCGT